MPGASRTSCWGQRSAGHRFLVGSWCPQTHADPLSQDHSDLLAARLSWQEAGVTAGFHLSSLPLDLAGVHTQVPKWRETPVSVILLCCPDTGP